MFKIGDFSRLSRVSIRALRLYDQMGLLKPRTIDPDTGYRYYAAEQLSRLNQIVAFKDLGFSLEQIAELLNDQIPPIQIWGMLRLRQAEVQQQIEAEQTRLIRIEARLKQLEAEATSFYPVVLKPVAAQTVAAIRDVLPTCSQIKQLHTELKAALQCWNVATIGFPQTLWHDPDYRLHDIDAEAIIPINWPDAHKEKFGTERVIVYCLPEVQQMACVVHHGSYETVVQAFNALLHWIEANHYRMAGPNRELYLHPQGMNPEKAESTDESVIEIQLPVCEA